MMSSDVFSVRTGPLIGAPEVHIHYFVFIDLNIVSSNSNIQCIIENRHGEIYSLMSVPLPELEKVNDLNPDDSEERVAAWIESHHQSFPFSCSCEP